MNDLWDLIVSFAGHMACHLGIALFLSLGIYVWFRSWKWALLCFVASFYTDLDHLYEYTLAYSWDWELKSIFTGEYFKIVDKRYVWLHSYETLVVVWLLAWTLKKIPAAVAFSFGFLGHLMIDQITYPLTPLAYSLIHRWANGFSPEAFGGI